MLDSKSYGLQNETRQYLRRLYSNGRELDGTDIADIDNFIAGLKQLNLWQNIVCWPMRRRHNIGTGSKVLSLGGIGTYDGTMTNSPSWDDMGILFDGTARYIEMANPLKPTIYCAGLTMFAIFDSDVTIATQGVVIGSNGTGASNTLGPAIYVSASPAQGTSLTAVYPDFSINGATISILFSSGSGNTRVMETFCAGFIGNTGIQFFEYNNTTRGTSSSIGSNTVWNNNPTWRIGARNSPAAGGYFLGTIPFCLLANRPITRTEYESLRDLHKTTIGKGLGLP